MEPRPRPRKLPPPSSARWPEVSQGLVSEMCIKSAACSRARTRTAFDPDSLAARADLLGKRGCPRLTSASARVRIWSNARLRADEPSPCAHRPRAESGAALRMGLERLWWPSDYGRRRRWYCERERRHFSRGCWGAGWLDRAGRVRRASRRRQLRRSLLVDRLWAERNARNPARCVLPGVHADRLSTLPAAPVRCWLPPREPRRPVLLGVRAGCDDQRVSGPANELRRAQQSDHRQVSILAVHDRRGLHGGRADHRLQRRLPAVCGAALGVRFDGESAEPGRDR